MDLILKHKIIREDTNEKKLKIPEITQIDPNLIEKIKHHNSSLLGLMGILPPKPTKRPEAKKAKQILRLFDNSPMMIHRYSTS